ncbi:ABC transporter ATP-binding protein [Sinanaerobacter chloroacetimidivorans]|uniref:ABC transporter ATP-binding protein n=1 Tax=Sinanaerobacter chloroacetimidivorans TaxID=2818044 RepID=A0A8J7W1K5_9FIRM|nr:ABC transporter ATP-binding protein [Sinanaerobacter chloroacetimidivorans]MBR0599157.1 ABC transporter ATP-binding protein [Sinanaerobacter chloroacetimidivorans]
MNKTKQLDSKKTTYLIRRFAPYFKKYKWILLLDLFCAALTTVCELVLPLIVRYITDKGMNDLEALTVEIILSIGGIYLALRLIDVAANYFMANVGHVMGAKIETDMRRDLFSHLQDLSYSYYSNTKIGQLMARITSDLFDITEFAHHCPEEYFIAALKFIVSFVILSSVNPWLTLIIFAIIPIMIYCSMQFNRKMRSAFKRSRNQIGELNSQVEDSLLGIRVVKSFANEEIEEEKFEEGNKGFLNIKKEAYRYMAGFQSTTRLFDGVMYITVVVAGALFMIRGLITPSDLIAYLLYVTMLLTSVRRIVEFTEQFQRGMTGIERFIEVMDEPVEIQDEEGSIPLPQVEGDIRFDQVSFRYSDGDNDVLSDINLHVKAGDHVALVGPSGGGKTTLSNLIPRFYDVTAGRILIDGHDIKKVTIHSLRSQIGVVQQEVYLFSGSIYDNIEYGKPGASREEIINAAKLAGAHDFITELPEGYETYVGERGVKLSGGQKQRISIARVFLKNPPILILDEATSALDNESELLVQQSLEELAKGRTTFTIAHRLTTIRNASVILVLTDQGIVEQGSHEELIEKKGAYYRLYNLYNTAGTNIGD